MGTGGVRHDERTDSELVLAVRGQDRDQSGPDPDAFGVLFDRWYDRCWNVARNIIRSDDLAAEVAQDAMLAGWQRIDQLHDPDAFGGWLLRITRNRALTRLEREGRSRATGDGIVSAMRDRNIAQSHEEPLGAQAPLPVEKVLEVHDRQELVWAASAALGERDASLLDLHLRHGLTPAEIAEELGMEANATHQLLFRLRNRLGDAIGSYLLWRNGRTLCRGLAAAVSGDVAFDRSVARAVARHQKTCDECAERRAGLVSPTKLFASVPFLVVPFQFKIDAAAALAEAGVPIDPSALGASAPPPGPSSGSTQGPNPQGPNPPGPGQPPPSPAPPEHSILGGDSPSVSSAVAGPARRTPAGWGSTSGVGWTTARSAWLKSLGGATVVTLAGLLLIGLLPGVALSDLWPFGGESSSIGSETLAGPAIDGTSTTAATEAATADAEGAASSDPTDPSSSTTATDRPMTVTTSSPTTPTTASSTTGSTATTATTGTSSSTTDTTVTTVTTETTTDTRPTTSTDRDTTSSPSTTENPDTAPPPPSRIVRFTSRVADLDLRCNSPNDQTYEALWVTEHATSVELFLPDGSRVPGEPKGSHGFCGHPGDSISLRSIGPGGDDKESIILG